MRYTKTLNKCYIKVLYRPQAILSAFLQDSCFGTFPAITLVHNSLPILHSCIFPDLYPDLTVSRHILFQNYPYHRHPKAAAFSQVYVPGTRTCRTNAPCFVLCGTTLHFPALSKQYYENVFGRKDPQRSYRRTINGWIESIAEQPGIIHCRNCHRMPFPWLLLPESFLQKEYRPFTQRVPYPATALTCELYQSFCHPVANTRYHARIVFDRINHETWKSRNLNNDDIMQIQNLASDTLLRERGRSKGITGK